jgi:hypothetical protein
MNECTCRRSCAMRIRLQQVCDAVTGEAEGRQVQRQ